MNTTSPAVRPCTLRRFVAAALTTLGLAASALPAAALEDPPAGLFELTFYQDSRAQGAWTARSANTAAYRYGTSMPPGWNDNVSSWSFCNDMAIPLYVTLQFYQDINFLGSSDTPVTHAEVQPGTCITGNHMWVNDVVSSYRWWTETN